MIYFVAVVIVWIIITLAGHLTWIIIAAIGRAIFRTDPPPERVKHPSDDIAASHRVVSRMAAALLISPQEAAKLRDQIDRLNPTAWQRATPAATPRPDRQTTPSTVEPVVEPLRPARGQETSESQKSPPHVEVPPHPDVDHRASLPTTHSHQELSEPTSEVGRSAIEFPAEQSGASPEDKPPLPEIDSPVVQPDGAIASRSASREPMVPVGPRASVGKSMAEFLAEHNIRWGELIAGMLIVICSIGLVISLWKTMTQMHRVIPSLIFLTGNTAIFGAGLYTLFRWRLQDTSRATLVIATLLVPLGILAGLSTGGIGSATVQLNDPVTIAAILGAGAIYLILLWHSSRALVGSSDALAMTIGVAGPAAVLPIVPAAIRVWGDSAGFICYAGSIAIALAVSSLIWRGKRHGTGDQTSRGNASGRRALVIGVSAFSLSVLAGYAAFMLRESETAWQAIATATLPGLVVLSAAAGSLSNDKKRPQLALGGTVIGWIGVFAGCAILVPSMISLGWLWTWALSFSSAAALAAIVFRSPRWTVIASLPLGLAVLLCSPVVASEVPWADIPIWKRMIGGEPMLASLAVGLFNLAVAWLLPVPNQRKALLGTGIGWLAYATLGAAVLTVAPTSLMGAIEPWVLSALLGGSAIAMIGAAYRYGEFDDTPMGRKLKTFGFRNSKFSLSTILHVAAASAATFAFWVSVFKPVEFGQPFPGWQPALMTLLSTALSCLLAGEVLVKRDRHCSVFRSFASCFFLATALSAVFCVLQTTADLDPPVGNIPFAIGALVASVVAWLWIGLSDRFELHLVLARVFLVVTAAVIGHTYCHDQLFTRDAWRNGLALWAWSAVGWSIVAAIEFRDLAIRLTKRIPSTVPFSTAAARCDWYDPTDRPWDITTRGVLVYLSTAPAIIASLIAFGSLVAADGYKNSLGIYTGVALPVAVLVATGLALNWPLKAKSSAPVFRMVMNRIHLAASLAWIGWQLATRILTDPSEQLVLATSLVASGCFLLDLIRPQRDDCESRFAYHGLTTTIGLGFVAVSSTFLLGRGWWPAILQGLPPDRFTTLSVSTWWTVAALTAGWLGHRNRSRTLACVCAVLVPAVVVLVMPLWVPTQWWVWVQAAAIASGVLAVSLRIWGSNGWGGRSALRLPATIDLSATICGSVGIASCIGVVVGVLRHDASWMRLHNLAGVVLAFAAAGLMLHWNRFVDRRLRIQGEMSWPILLSLTSGHLALLLTHFWGASMSPQQWLPIVWIVTAIVSLVEYCRRSSQQSQSFWFNRWHAGVLIIAASALCLIDGSNANDFTVGVIACIVGGVLATARSVLAAWDTSDGIVIGKRARILTRGLCWYVLVAGGLLLLRLCTAASASEFQFWTLLIAWIGGWGLIWRLSCPERDRGVSGSGFVRSMLADAEASLLVMTAIGLEVVGMAAAPLYFAASGTFEDPLLWIRLGFAVAIAASVCFRFQRPAMLETAIMTGLAASVLLSLHLGNDRLLAPATLATIVSLVVSSVFATIVFVSSLVCRIINAASRGWPGFVPPNQQEAFLGIPQFARSLTRVGTIPAILVVALSGWLLVNDNSATIVPVTICGVAIMAAAVAELSERTGQEYVRYKAMLLGMASIAMWASVKVDQTGLPLLTLSTRWFVGWVFVSGGLAYLAPKLLGEQVYTRWKNAIRMGLVVSLALTTLALGATLMQEGSVRLAGQTALLVKPLYLGMAATLALLSLMCTLGGILSGPGYSYREIWKLTDGRRKSLVVAAQAFGGLTWFHLFLCKSPLASLGLRAYWPYVVMALCFASVGITEWARRRRDEVLSQTLRQTALFLPLVPVIGFWLSGSWVTSLFGQSDSNGWSYIEGRVSYQALLVAAALYYGVVSFLWKSGRARLVSIVIGNLALWVILVQTPNWDFLKHPQAWLIPPAVCVLITAHLHRESLGPELTRSIRYAATLTIYVTSTADMLIQGIGTTIMGPILLIVLALVGAGAGVAFRVKPFLYLGTTFVFLGVTSMVWHAQKQIDAVWPWWVFGISAGVLLMTGLMAIEKNKPRLRRIATSMQQWEA